MGLGDNIIDLGCDANSFIAGVNAGAQSLNPLISQLDAVAERFLKIEKVQVGSTAAFTTQISEGVKMTQTYEVLDEGVKRLNTRINVNTNALAENTQANLLAGVSTNNLTNDILKERYALQAVWAEYAKVDAAVEAHNAAEQRLKATLTGMPVAVTNLGRVMTETGEKGRSAAAGLLISWQSFQRLLLVQTIHTAFRNVIGLLREATQNTIEFEQRITEIRTISQDNARTFDDWAAAARKLSDTFGDPALQAAEGIYQALSSQLVNANDATILVGKAMSFAHVTLSTTRESVDLLTAALNSYHLSATDADRVSAALFKTIVLGKLRAEDLVSVWARSGPFAHQLGLSIEQVGAAFATFTQSGMKASEASVLLNNLLSHLVKPTKDMKDLFHAWGVSSGEDAVALFGFEGVLKKISDATHGSATEIGKLERDLRAIRAEISLSGQGFDRYQKNLSEMEKAEKEYNEAQKLNFESSGAILKREMTQIRNFIMDDFSRPLLDGIKSIAHAFSKEGLLGTFKGFMEILTAGIGTLVAYKLANMAVNQVQAARTTLLIANKQAELENSFAHTLGTEAMRSRTIAEINAVRVTEINTAVIGLNIRMQAAASVGNLEYAHTLNGEVIALETEAVSLEASTAEHLKRAGALELEADAITDVTGRSLLASRAIGGLGAVLSSPVFLLTAAITAIGYFIYQHSQAVSAMEEGGLKAAQAMQTAEEKITEAVQKETTKQTEAWNKALEARFASYRSFTIAIENKLDEYITYESDKAKESVDITKEAIREFLRAQDEKFNELKHLEKQAHDDTLRLREDLDRQAQTFAEREFNRKMRQAEHDERMAEQGKGKGKGAVNEEQIALVHAAQDKINEDILAARGQARGATNPKEVADLQKRINKDFDERQKHQDDLNNRRLSMEEQLLKVKTDISAIDDRIGKDTGKQTTDAKLRDLKAGEAAIRANKKLKPGVHVDTGLTEIKGQESDLRQQIGVHHDADTIAKDQKARDILISRQAALEKGLALAGTQQDYEAKSLDTERERREATELILAREKEIEETKKKELEVDKAAFSQVHLALKEIDKFKTDLTKVKSRADLEARISHLDRFITKANAGGDLDPGLMQKLMEERNELARLGLGLIDKKTLTGQQEEFTAIQKGQEAGRLKATKVREESEANISKRIVDAARILGTEDEGENIGSIKGGFKASWMDRPGPFIEQAQAKARRALFALQDEKTKAEQETRPIDPKVFTDFKAAIEELKTAIYNPKWKELKSAAELKVGQKQDEHGANIPVFLDEEIENLRKTADAIGEESNRRSDTIKSLTDFDADIKKTQDTLTGINKALAPLAEPIDDTKNQFKSLNERLLEIIPSIIELKRRIDAITIPGTTTVPTGTSYAPQAPRNGLTANFNPNYNAAKPQFEPQQESSRSISIGEIHAHVHSTGNQEIDAKQLVVAIQREIRRTGDNFNGDFDA